RVVLGDADSAVDFDWRGKLSVISAELYDRGTVFRWRWVSRGSAPRHAVLRRPWRLGDDVGATYPCGSMGLSGVSGDCVFVSAAPLNASVLRITLPSAADVVSRPFAVVAL